MCTFVDTQLAEHSYQYLTTGEDLKGLQEDRHKVWFTPHCVLKCQSINQSINHTIL